MLTLRCIIFWNPLENSPRFSGFWPFRNEDEKLSTTLKIAQVKVHTKAHVPEFKLITRF